MFGPDNNHLIERLLILAIENEHKRANVLALQYANEEMRADLLTRERALVEQSAAHVARTSEAQEKLDTARLEGLPIRWVSPEQLLSGRERISIDPRTNSPRQAPEIE